MTPKNSLKQFEYANIGTKSINWSDIMVTDLGESLLPLPITGSRGSDPLQGFVFGLVSPGVQDKIDNLEGLKRKCEGSPEEDLLTRKEKKLLKSEEKKKKKQEVKDNRRLQGSKAT